ncbi:hypothetical protein AAG906_005467 [Vitis piasezkii]
MRFVLNKWGGIGMGATCLEPAPLPSYLRDRSMDLSPKYKLGKGLDTTDWIFSNPAAASSSDMDATTSSTPTADAGLPDGGTSIYSDFLDKNSSSNIIFFLIILCRKNLLSTMIQTWRLIFNIYIN